MSTSKKVCVFCSASDRVDAAYKTAAQTLGSLIGQRNHSLVWGGGKVGLMGEVARSAQSAGATLFGVIPESMQDIEIAYTDADQLVVTQTMRERKALMDSEADAFIILPGGIGTLEELTEIMVLRYLKYHDRPIILINTNNFYDPFIKLMQHYVDEKFAKPKHMNLFTVVDTPAQALDLL
ncbi:LOG family protein [Poriferisphaera corsica]|uniref:LOG family protein n=1 Tax=Poriferisphaera corsica TaxID=2528020 RepID=UPI0011A73FA6|nr:TIGR00730 family Rossman fold protein [Poriferisphaera corsica]